MYTLMHVKWMTNKNLLYKKIKLKKKKKKDLGYVTSTCNAGSLTGSWDN